MELVTLVRVSYPSLTAHAGLRFSCLLNSRSSEVTKENGSSWIFKPRLTCANALRRVQHPAFALVCAVGTRGQLARARTSASHSNGKRIPARRSTGLLRLYTRHLYNPGCRFRVLDVLKLYQEQQPATGEGGFLDRASGRALATSPNRPFDRGYI
jgi:hypothetical protein